MALDELVKSYKKYRHIGGIEETLRQDGDAPEAYESFAEFMQEYRGISETDAQAMFESNDMNSKTARRYARMLRSESIKDFTDEFEANYDEIIENIGAEKLKEIAIKLEDGKKKYLLFEKLLSSSNQIPDEAKIERMKQLVAEKYKDGFWQDFVSHANPAIIKEFARNYYAEDKINFIRKNLQDEETVEEDGKKVKKYSDNLAKIKDYIKKTIKGYKEKEHKQNAYLQIAQYLSS